MEKKVNVLGQELTIRFNMSVEIIYEELINKPFNINETTERAKERMALINAAVAASNDIPEDFAQRLATEASAQEIAALINAIYQCFADWAKMPAVEAEEDKPEETEGDPKKN